MNKIRREMAEELSLKLFPPELSETSESERASSAERRPLRQIGGSKGSDMIANP